MTFKDIHPVLFDGKKQIAEYDSIDFAKKIFEEAAEFHEAMVEFEGNPDSEYVRAHLIEEALDLVTSVATPLNAYGIVQDEIDVGACWVGEKNRTRKYF